MQAQVQHKVHHDTRPYAVANKESAEKARALLKSLIESGKSRADEAIKSVEKNVPHDALVPAKKAEFANKGNILKMTYDGGKNEYNVHPHAYSQFLERAAIPKKFGDTLLAEDPELLAYNLNQRYHKSRADKTYLSRAVGGQIRGWLSDSFQRFDVLPMVKSFLATCKSFQAVPVGGQNLDTRFYMKMLLPSIFEPIEGEVIAFGIQFRSSDYGDGAYDIRGFVHRTWCTNEAMTEECLRQVHLGAKLRADQFSQTTMTKQAEMLASATKDVVGTIFSPDAIKARLDWIKESDEKQITISNALAAMRKNSKITKDEEERVRELLTSNDVTVLPPVRGKPEKGKASAWRFSNAFSALAKEKETDARRAMDLEMIAGEIANIQRKPEAVAA